MSEALWGVLIGALLAPLIRGIGYLFQRQHQKEDRNRSERREALITLQDTLLNLVRTEEALQVADDSQRNEIIRDIAIAKREVRFRAARIGDKQLWEMVNTPPDQTVRLVVGEKLGPGDPSFAPDRYDQWNARIRELFEEL